MADYDVWWVSRIVVFEWYHLTSRHVSGVLFHLIISFLEIQCSKIPALAMLRVQMLGSHLTAPCPCLDRATVYSLGLWAL